MIHSKGRKLEKVESAPENITVGDKKAVTQISNQMSRFANMFGIHSKGVWLQP